MAAASPQSTGIDAVCTIVTAHDRASLDKTVEAATVLARSVRQHSSHLETLVLYVPLSDVGDQATGSHLTMLALHFDEVLRLDASFVPADVWDVVQHSPHLVLWALTSFSRLVYIDPSSVVTGSVDLLLSFSREAVAANTAIAERLDRAKAEKKQKSPPLEFRAEVVSISPSSTVAETVFATARRAKKEGVAASALFPHILNHQFRDRIYGLVVSATSASCLSVCVPVCLCVCVRLCARARSVVIFD